MLWLKRDPGKNSSIQSSPIFLYFEITNVYFFFINTEPKFSLEIALLAFLTYQHCLKVAYESFSRISMVTIRQ